MYFLKVNPLTKLYKKSLCLHWSIFKQTMDVMRIQACEWGAKTCRESPSRESREEERLRVSSGGEQMMHKSEVARLLSQWILLKHMKWTLKVQVSESATRPGLRICKLRALEPETSLGNHLASWRKVISYVLISPFKRPTASARSGARKGQGTLELLSQSASQGAPKVRSLLSCSNIRGYGENATFMNMVDGTRKVYPRRLAAMAPVGKQTE